jgi:hypothetical protein
LLLQSLLLLLEEVLVTVTLTNGGTPLDTSAAVGDYGKQQLLRYDDGTRTMNDVSRIQQHHSTRDYYSKSGHALSTEW